VVVLFVFVVLLAMLCFPLGLGPGLGREGWYPPVREGWVEVPPPIGGRLLRTYRRLLAISALISVSAAHFRIFPLVASAAVYL
jgi:hypothetical protein